RDLAGHLPDAALLDIVRAFALQLRIFRDAAAADLLDLLNECQVDAVVVHDIAVGIGTGDDLAAELADLLHRVDGDVAGARDDRPLALEIGAAGGQHLAHEEDGAEAGGLGAGARAAIDEALAGEHARLVAVGDPLVLAEQIADLAPAHADIARRHVGIFAEMAVHLGHEGLAEAHDLRVGAAARVEVRAALAAADRHAGQRVLKGL